MDHLKRVDKTIMKFIADLHVHSKFSRATAKNLDFENLYIAAQLKGITVVATGDFTHPGWFAEIKEKLLPAEQGLFKLKKDIARECDKKVPLSCRKKVRFILVSEISNIYKKNDKTRKNHNLVFVPDLDTADKFNSKLDKIGNIKSDGRPILGLDARNLLEILLETSDDSFLIPAHIWTPWFSVLGSKSGFNSIQECFEDLTPHIFAAETGLSSDPPMNWRVSSLDNVTLISNSDAHSPLKLGREANILNTTLSYPAIKDAIKTGDPERFLGTFEFYPEEGKYFLDGHRKCSVCLRPDKTIENKGICPVCGKPLTVGVLYRVEELADRPENENPNKIHPYYSIVPLDNLLSEILRVGPKSKKVMKNYSAALESLGSELSILHDMDTELIAKAGIPLLDEAVRRMRRNEINISPGYDGEYGIVKIFKDDERERLMGQKSLFIMGAKSLNVNTDKNPITKNKEQKIDFKGSLQKNSERKSPAKKSLNTQQRQAVCHDKGPLMVVAGPGTGKTHTITSRIAFLIKEKDVLPENILAITFTNKAAGEMKNRIERFTGKSVVPNVGTFHSFCLKILKEQKGNHNYTIIDDDDRMAMISEAINLGSTTKSLDNLSKKYLADKIISAKQQLLQPQDNLEFVVKKSETDTFAAIYQAYQNILSAQQLYDFEDLILKACLLFEGDRQVCDIYRQRFKYIFVDEYQDINYGQYCLIKALAPPDKDLCVIGDPNQAIYGFRGSNAGFFSRFLEDYPKGTVIHLDQNYRSAQTILKASCQILSNQSIDKKTGQASISRVYSLIEGVNTISVFELASEKAEAVAIGKTIEALTGGLSLHAIDSGKIENMTTRKERSFSDFVVLYRTNSQSKVIAEVFQKAGIPFQIARREKLFREKGVLEIISIFKIMEERCSFVDLKRAVNLLSASVSDETVKIFTRWCCKNNFTLKKGFYNARRFPIPDMSKSRQLKFNDFLINLAGLQKAVNKKSVEEKLRFIIKNTKLALILKQDPKINEAVIRLMEMSKDSGDNSTEFFEITSLQTDTDIYDSRAEKVALMTMHAAKGLEFPVVFIAGCEKGFIPFIRHEEELVDLDEERRLFYVAMTRAKERLYLTMAKKRTIYGKNSLREISPFVKDIEKNLIKNKKAHLNKKTKHSQLTLF